MNLKKDMDPPQPTKIMKQEYERKLNLNEFKHTYTIPYGIIKYILFIY